MPTFSRFTETYTSFSGADIVANFAGTTIATLSGITWSITREKAPIYTMGSPNPRSFSRGKRGIAGSLIFTTMDRPALYDMLVAHVNDPSIKYYTRVSNVLPGLGDVQHRGIVPAYPTDGNLGNYVDVVNAMPYYSDQIPPFDVTITFANEYGQAAVKSLYGVEILNEGSGASMDDVVIEETMTFVAREVGPIVATRINPATGGGELNDFNTSELNSQVIVP
jgi:hypothetical protein